MENDESVKTYLSKENIKILLEFVAVFSSVLYFIGFLSVNSYLFEFGYSGVNFLSPNFFTVGFVIALCITNFYFMGGRQILALQSAAEAEVSVFKDRDLTPAQMSTLTFLIFSHETINAFFVCSVGIATFLQIFFIDMDGLYFFIYISFVFIILYPMNRLFNIDLKNPIFYRVLETILKIIGIIVYFYFMNYSGPTLNITIYFYGAMFLLNMIADRLDKRVFNVDRSIHLFTAFTIVSMTLTFSVLFGQNINKYLRGSFGGGAPQRVSIVLSNDLSKLIDPQNHEQTITGYIVYRDGKNIIFNIKNSEFNRNFLIPENKIQYTELYYEKDMNPFQKKFDQILKNKMEQLRLKNSPEL